MALADQIDGNWCSPTGKTLSVDGPQVVTPGGSSVTANYDRHHVDFIIPKGEARAGERFVADQLGDEEIKVTIAGSAGAKIAKPEIWTPCKPTV